jgi:hypothetical protein
MSYWGGTDEGGGANTQTNTDWKPEIYTQTATNDGGNGGNGGVGDGNGGPGEYEHETPWYMDSMKYGQKFSFGAPPSSFGSVGSGGKGGAGMVGALGDFQYDKFGYDPYSGAAMSPETYTADTYTADTYTANPLAQDYQYGAFTSPNEAVDFREFQAPTQQEAAADQGYQFRLAQGQRALENAAAAKGMLRTGNTWKDLMDYGQGAASQEYDKVYGRQLGEHNLAYQQALQANQDRYGRAVQGWQMNRQNVGDMYGRALTDDQRRMQAQQLTEQSRTGAQRLTEQSRTGAQQLSEQSRFGAHAANLGVHQANYGIASGVHDRNFQGANTAYNYAMQRAMHESQLAESAASRAQSASAANAARGERAYDKAYGRAMDEYLLGYDQFKDAEQEAWNRNKWGVELGVRTAGSDNQ